MRRHHLLQLALLGMAVAGLGVPLESAQKPAQVSATELSPRQKQFYDTLNPQTQGLFMQLSPADRDLAIHCFNAPRGHNMCAGLNACSQPTKHECAGVNGCPTPGNACQGQGSCKNTHDKTFTDPNQAVQVVYNKMMSKRQALDH
jgi:hypothetical protein